MISDIRVYPQQICSEYCKNFPIIKQYRITDMWGGGCCPKCGVQRGDYRFITIHLLGKITKYEFVGYFQTILQSRTLKPLINGEKRFDKSAKPYKIALNSFKI